MAAGVLKVFNLDRGFGFIKPDDGSDDVFVHVSAADRAGIVLHQGMRLGFDLEKDRKTGKPRAGNLTLL